MNPIRLGEIDQRQRFEHRTENESAGGDSPVLERVPSVPSPDLASYLDARRRGTSEAERSSSDVFGPRAPADP